MINELSKEIFAGKVSKDSDIVLDAFDGKMVFQNRSEKEAAAEYALSNFGGLTKLVFVTSFLTPTSPHQARRAYQ